MITYLPTIYPDELVYSWLSRYYVHSGCLTHKMALQELYQKRSDNPSKEFIGNLNVEAKKIIEAMYPIKELILNHTMFNQYSRFIPLKQKKEALYKLSQESCDVHQLFCVLPKAEGERYLRYCPMCVAEDREKYSETYWHRRHQIRNISVCTKHLCRLIESKVSAKSEQCFTFEPAEVNVQDIEIVYEATPLVIQYTSYVETVFNAPMTWENDIPISAILYECMCHTKYMKSSERSRNTKMLVEDMKLFYEDMGLYNIASMYQIQRVLLGIHFDFSVVCQIAFFLGITVEELTASSLTHEQIQREQKSHYMREKMPIDWEVLDEEIAPILEKYIHGVYSGEGNPNGRPERVAERRVYQHFNLSLYGLQNMPRCKAILERYIEPYPESWARKIIWAYKKLKIEKKAIYWSDIRELAGVKKSNITLIMPFLSKYADEKTANEIMRLARL